jgi:hypothetical protein
MSTLSPHSPHPSVTACSVFTAVAVPSQSGMACCQRRSRSTPLCRKILIGHSGSGAAPLPRAGTRIESRNIVMPVGEYWSCQARVLFVPGGALQPSNGEWRRIPHSTIGPAMEGLTGPGPDHPSILDEVRQTCSRVVQATTDIITISDEAIQRYVDEFSVQNAEEVRRGVEWDASGWHYSADAADCGPLTCQYVFVMDSLNFCFWPTPGLEYDTLAVSLKNVLDEDNHAFDADRLSCISAETLSGWFSKSGYTLPLLEERVKRLRELGRGLIAEFNGQCIEVVRRANKSAARLVNLIVSHFQGFVRVCLHTVVLPEF